MSMPGAQQAACPFVRFAEATTISWGSPALRTAQAVPSGRSLSVHESSTMNPWRTGFGVAAVAWGFVLLGMAAGFGAVVFLYLSWAIVALLASPKFADNSVIVDVLAWVLYLAPYALVGWRLARRLRERSTMLHWAVAAGWTLLYGGLVLFAFPPDPF
jgi:hypothetical protein